MRSRQVWVYILASKTRRLYVGVTGNLRRRMYEHKSGAIPGFARRYGINRLVFGENAERPRDASAADPSLRSG